MHGGNFTLRPIDVAKREQITVRAVVRLINEGRIFPVKWHRWKWWIADPYVLIRGKGATQLKRVEYPED